MAARIRLRSSGGERELAAGDFFVGLLSTAIQPDEILVEIDFPRPPARSGSCFMEIARRRGDFAIAGVAAVITVDADRRCADVRLALCGVGETPVDASDAAGCLVGEAGADKLFDEAAAGVQQAVEPSGNVHASSDYQRHVAGVIARRALATAYQRAADAA